MAVESPVCAAIAIAAADPREDFGESKLVVENLALALGEKDFANVWIAESYAVRAAKVMLKIGQTRNSVIDLSAAQTSIIGATADERAEIQILASQILARLNSPDAQRSIAAAALIETNAIDIRIAALNSLAISANFLRILRSKAFSLALNN